MAETAGWTPDSQVLNSVVELLRASLSPCSETQKRVRDGIEELKLRSDGAYYVCYVFSTVGFENEIRQLAGLLLKNMLTTGALDDWIGTRILQGLCDPSDKIRSTSGTIITNILRTIGIGKWPAALSMLNNLIINAPSVEIAVSGLETYKKIVQDELEDRSSYEDSRSREGVAPAFKELSTREFIPMLLHLSNNPQVDKSLKLVCLEILEVFNTAHAFATSDFAEEFFQPYWDCIGRVAMDPRFRLLVLNCFNTVLEYNVDMILQNSATILQFFVESSDDPDYNVRLAAINFWPEILKESASPIGNSDLTLKDAIAPHVRRLTAILVEHSRCTDIDLAELDPAQLEDDNALVPDVTNLAPRFHQTRQLGGDFDCDLDDDQDDHKAKSAWGNVWTVRKATGLALDTLSVYFGGEVMLPVCLPVIERKLQTFEDIKTPQGDIVPAWMERESGILILGAISVGCMNALSQFIPNILSLLVKISADAKPLLRSISCWCMARFSSWYCKKDQASDLPNLELPKLAVESLGSNLNRPSTYLQIALYALLVRMLDMNKCVQEASCSAISILFEDVGEIRKGITVHSSKEFNARNIVAMELPVIYECFGKCLCFYQTKNMTLLLDAISSLAQSIGSDLTEAHPHYVNEKLFGPLFEKFNALDPEAYETSSCCEALTNVTNAIGQSILPMAPRIIAKALSMIEYHLIKIKSSGKDERHSTDVTEACIDLVSYLLETAGSDSATLLDSIQPAAASPNISSENAKTARSQLMQIIHICICDPDFSGQNSFHQSIFALVGDIAPNAYNQILKPILPNILPVITLKLLHRLWPVSSNASWCLGQIVDQAPDGDPVLAPFVPTIVENLGQIIIGEQHNLALKQNASVTLGRFAVIYPQAVVPTLERVLVPWCTLMSQYKNVPEKIKAFRGIMKSLMYAPATAKFHVDALNDCVADFYDPHHPQAADIEFRNFRESINQWFTNLRSA